MNQPVLVTGAAGFIGAAVCERLLERGEHVVGLDNLNNYYDPSLKQARLDRLDGIAAPAWSFHRLDLADGEAMAALFAATKPRAVVHLAAQAGVRYSLRIPPPISRRIWWVLASSWKVAATTALSIWCIPPAVRCMAATRRCRLPKASR